ncbi:MAG: hypothetical protein PCFJNLEI_04104 [Verrucomicrobiae bacterium]|nr:hypothetical protein [Verrucomicrobiae bacterium]
MDLDTTGHSRPRNVDWKRAAALLYGDWGTSKAYVPGIAFAIAMYSSFWFVLAVGALTLLVGINYIWVCKYFPEGGGVYSSAKAHSRTLALFGGFLLAADYIVTASLSCFEAFVYFNCSYEDAKRWAILAIFIIGVINFFGPRHSGSLAMMLGLGTFGVLVILAAFCLPQLSVALAAVEKPHRDPVHWWGAFVGCVLALSGVEAIANMTGVMKPDPNSPRHAVSVARTARKAILPVMIEVVVLTTLFGLVMHAVRGLDRHEHEGDMLRHLAGIFVDGPIQNIPWLAKLGELHIFSTITGVVIGGLLLSATNTAMVALVSVLYLMSRDDELPQPFSMLNRFGVPWILMLIAILAPILVLDIQGTEQAVQGLAALYAIGVVGAIGVNLGSTAFNFQLPMRRHERTIMMATFFIIAAIEITIAITKPKALLFAVCVIGLGFIARALHKGASLRLPAGLRRLGSFLQSPTTQRTGAKPRLPIQLGPERPIHAIMVAARGVTPTLRFALDEARAHRAELIVLYVREEFTQIPTRFREEDDQDAQAVFQAVRALAGDTPVTTIYAVSDDPAWTILDNAAIAGVDTLILGHSRRLAFTRVLRGDLLHKISSQLPEEIRLLIIG